MTAQKATYGMDYLNHAQPKDVLVWIRMNTDILPNVGSIGEQRNITSCKGLLDN